MIFRTRGVLSNIQQVRTRESERERGREKHRQRERERESEKKMESSRPVSKVVKACRFMKLNLVNGDTNLKAGSSMPTQTLFLT